MSDAEVDRDLRAYLDQGESWAKDRADAARSSLRLAWIVAGVLAVTTVAEAIAIATMMPLKTVVPYTLMVDRQTGYIQAIKPLERDIIAPDRALIRSFIAQYVIAREGFDIGSLKDDYRKVSLWSTGEARDRYITGMQATNPASPLATMPRSALVEVEIRGITSLSSDSALVRFVTTRSDAGGQSRPAQPWQAVVSYRFSNASMNAVDRLTNPLGFQVTRYRRDAELAPEPGPAPAPPPPPPAPQPAPYASPRVAP